MPKAFLKFPPVSCKSPCFESAVITLQIEGCSSARLQGIISNPFIAIFNSKFLYRAIIFSFYHAIFLCRLFVRRLESISQKSPTVLLLT